MFEALSFATSALRTARTRFDARANNVANVVTPGFRSQRVDAVDAAGGGVRVGAIRTDPRSGGLDITGSGLDLAIQGAGFFEVQTPQGARFTRTGSFSTDGQGSLVDAAGNRVAPGIQVPGGTTSIAVAGDGTVTAFAADGSSQVAGRIELVRFANPGGLLREGGNLFAPSPSSGGPVAGGGGVIVAGALELSNVDLVTELVGQIGDKNFFFANLATIRAEREMLGELLDIFAD